MQLLVIVAVAFCAVFVFFKRIAKYPSQPEDEKFDKHRAVVGFLGGIDRQKHQQPKNPDLKNISQTISVIH